MPRTRRAQLAVCFLTNKEALSPWEPLQEENALRCLRYQMAQRVWGFSYIFKGFCDMLGSKNAYQAEGFQAGSHCLCRVVWTSVASWAPRVRGPLSHRERNGQGAVDHSCSAYHILSLRFLPCEWEFLEEKPFLKLQCPQRSGGVAGRGPNDSWVTFSFLGAILRPIFSVADITSWYADKNLWI